MNRHQAHLIRCGIRAARNPELGQYVHLAHPLVREACRRETENMHWSELQCWLTNAQPNHTTQEHHATIRHVDELVRARAAADIPDTFKAARKEQA